MRNAAILILCILWTLGAFAQPVVVLSFDALAADAFTEATMPRLWALSRKGLRGRVLPPSPSTTFNGHATHATGCWPEHHGIVANAYLDPATGWVRHAAVAEQLLREPLWVAATRSGKRTAVFGWPCATGPWQGVRPWRLRPFDPKDSQAFTLRAVSRALDEGAELVMAYLPGVDEAGHRHGPGSRAWRAELARIDTALGAWIPQAQARHRNLRLVLTADHGMAAPVRRIDLAPLAGPEMLRIQAHGLSASFHLRPGSDPGPLLARCRAAGLEAWSRTELPRALHLSGSPRTGGVVVQAPADAWLSQGATEEARREEAGTRRGAHGSLRPSPELQGWLLVLGVRARGEIPAFALWDLAPTVAAWLDITWAQAPDGRAVPALRP